MRHAIRALTAAAVAVSVVATFGLPVDAEPPSGAHQHMMSGDAMPNHTMPGHAIHGDAPSPTAAAMPTLPGQDAFGAIQEIVGILEADPSTDWSKVRLEALRQHLIDMNELTLHAAAAATPVDGGLAITVTGKGRTLAAIQRMVPAHAPMIDGHNGWHARAMLLPDGARLTVTASDPREVTHIRGLGFIGLMATGAHHQAHHLAIAEGKRPMHTY